MDNAMGMHGDHPVYSDLDIDAIEAVPDTQFHRNVDIPIIAADKEGYLMSYIIAPGNIPSPVPSKIQLTNIRIYSKRLRYPLRGSC